MRPFSHSLAFSTQQKKGVAVLIGLLLIFHGMQWLFFTFSPAPPRDTLTLPAFNHSLSEPPSLMGINTADEKALVDIPGIGPILSKRIVSFRKLKGGFSSLTDLQEVYGLSQDTYSNMLPYLYLDPIPSTLTRQSQGTFLPKSKRVSSKKVIASIDINQADEQAFQQLPGIGPVLSKRIIRYRQAKRGFEQVEDLKRVYNLPDSTFEKILPYLFISSQEQRTPIDPTQPNDTAFLPQRSTQQLSSYSSSSVPPFSTKHTVPLPPSQEDLGGLLSPINLNTADTSQLKLLPGIGSTLSKRIVAYRKIIGFYSKVEFVGKVYGMSPETLEKISSFLYVDGTELGKTEDLNTIPEWKLKKYPFWLESELTAFLLWKNKIRRVDSWEEVERARVLEKATLEQLKIYFDL